MSAWDEYEKATREAENALRLSGGGNVGPISHYWLEYAAAYATLALAHATAAGVRPCDE